MIQSRLPSLKDVARAAGVSVTTVSRLLNGSLDLPSKTKKRIEDAIRDSTTGPTRMPGASASAARTRSGSSSPTSPTRSSPASSRRRKRRPDSKRTGRSLYATLNDPGREVAYVELLSATMWTA